jgi:hypothetical protein
MSICVNDVTCKKIVSELNDAMLLYEQIVQWNQLDPTLLNYDDLRLQYATKSREIRTLLQFMGEISV